MKIFNDFDKKAMNQVDQINSRPILGLGIEFLRKLENWYEGGQLILETLLPSIEKMPTTIFASHSNYDKLSFVTQNISGERMEVQLFSGTNPVISIKKGLITKNYGFDLKAHPLTFNLNEMSLSSETAEIDLTPKKTEFSITIDFGTKLFEIKIIPNNFLENLNREDGMRVIPFSEDELEDLILFLTDLSSTLDSLGMYELFSQKFKTLSNGNTIYVLAVEDKKTTSETTARSINDISHKVTIDHGNGKKVIVKMESGNNDIDIKTPGFANPTRFELENATKSFLTQKEKLSILTLRS